MAEGEITVEELMRTIARVERMRDAEPSWTRDTSYPPKWVSVKPDPVFGWLVVE